MAARKASVVPRTSATYERLRRSLFATPARVVELDVPVIRVISVCGNEPPGSRQFQDAVKLLFALGYQLKMGMKFGTVKRPKGYFDFRVGPLEALWWSTAEVLDVHDARTLRWQAYIMVPAFINKTAFESARRLARLKAPELPWAPVALGRSKEGRALQLLHLGPYDREGPTVERLRTYADARGMRITGLHHEIYLSDPRRTKADRLRTIIRLGVGRSP